MYLFRSVIWLTGFSLVYLIFLRSERFFRLKRFYLIAGIVISLVFPLITINYRVELPAPDAGLAGLVSDPMPEAQTLMQQDTGADIRSGASVLLFIYLAGILFCLIRIVKHMVILAGVIRNSDIAEKEGFKLVRVNEFRNSFSFFSYIFINPGVDDDEAEVILNHELVHVSQKHWFDLLLTEIMKMLQWVNPFAWVYSGFIKQNHEYLADERALQLAVDPAAYKAALVNQLFQAPVFSLTDSFSYSLNRSRFAMMKKVVVSPYRKMKVLFILPVAALILMAFARPAYHYPGTEPSPEVVVSDSGSIVQFLRGVVISEDGSPLRGATILVPGTNAGLVTDDDGSFTMANVPSDAVIVISAKGYLSKMEKISGAEPLRVSLEKDPDFRELKETITTADWTSSSQIDTEAPFVVVEEMPMFPDGDKALLEYLSKNVRYPEEAKAAGTEGRVIIRFIVTRTGRVEGVSVLKGVDPVLDAEAARLVGTLPDFMPGKQGGKAVDVWYMVPVTFSLGAGPEATEKSVPPPPPPPPPAFVDEEPFVVVEDMPEYPGGDIALLQFVNENTHYPEEAKAQNIQGRVIVRFAVTKAGNVSDITALKGVHPLLDAEAVRVVSLLKGFKPGMQDGKAVNVWYMLPVTFTLK